MDKQRREELRRSRDWSGKVQAESSDAPAGAGLDGPETEQFRKQSAEFNARVHRALADIPVPSALREQILARRKVIPVTGWRQHRAMLAAAAAVVLLAVLTIMVLGRRGSSEDTTFAGFRSRMVGFAIRQYSMDIRTNQLAAVQGYLAKSGAPADFSLPAGLGTRPVMGGAKLSWQGKPVGMVCFNTNTGKTLYMFVINSADAPGAAPAVNIGTEKTLAIATWNAAGRTFLLAGDVPPQELETLVKS